MNFLYHRQKSRGHVLPMPEGLSDLMADISREVLRCQPSMNCTYKFIADYLDAMVVSRDKSNIAMEVIEEAILKTDEVYSQFVKCNIPKEKTPAFLDMMEITFRRFVEQKRKLNEDPRFITFRADDMLDELMRKCDLTKIEILRSRPAIQWAYKKFVQTYLAAVEGNLDTEALYYDTEKLIASTRELQDLNESAIKIQKLYRGYHIRKTIHEMEQSTTGLSKSFKGQDSRNEIEKMTKAEKDEEDAFDREFKKSFERDAAWREEEKAAIRIQSIYKGYAVRKRITMLKEHHDVEEPSKPEKEEEESPVPPVPPVPYESTTITEMLETSDGVTTTTRIVTQEYYESVDNLRRDSSESHQDLSLEELKKLETYDVGGNPEDLQNYPAESRQDLPPEDSKAIIDKTASAVDEIRHAGAGEPPIEQDPVAKLAEEERLTNAAVKIQSSYKGFIVRKKMEEAKLAASAADLAATKSTVEELQPAGDTQAEATVEEAPNTKL